MKVHSLSQSLRWQFTILLLLVSLFGLPACQSKAGFPIGATGAFSQSPEPKHGVFKIGFLDALTGPAAVYGTELQRTAELATDEINANGGIQGKTLEIIYEDGKCDGSASATAGKKLIEVDTVPVIIGFSCSNQVFPILSISEANHVVLITSYSTHPDITRAGRFIFRNNYNDQQTAELLAEMVGSESSKVAILSENQEDTMAIENHFIKDISQSFPALRIVSKEHFDFGSSDMRAQITKILSKNPDVVVINPLSPETFGNSLKQLRELGFQGKVFTNWVLSGRISTTFGDLVKDVRFIGERSLNTPKKENLFRIYKQKYHETPLLDVGSTSIYDAIHLIKSAVEKNGESGQQIADYLHSMESYEGALGNYRFDDHGDLVGVNLLEEKIIINGTAVPFS